MRYLSREHWCDLITFEFILFLYSLIVRLCQKYLVYPSKSRNQLGVWQVVFFPDPEEILYFFNILFDIFWDSTNSACVSKLGEKGLVYKYLFTSQRESHSVSDMDFLAMFVLSHLELSRIELPKLTSSILMEIVTILVVLVDQFYFHMHQPIKPWPFEKIII